MPRKYYRKRNYGSRRKPSRTAVRAMRLLKALPKPELKAYETSSFGQAPNDSTGLAYNLALPAAGTGDNQRIGDEIRLNSVNVRIRVQVNASSPDTQVLKYYILWDKRGNSVSSASDIQSPVANGTAMASLAFSNWDKKSQFRILKTGNITVNPVGQPGDVKNKEIYMKLRNLMTHFDATTTTVNSGALKLVVVSGSASILPTFDMISRVTYYDA